MIKKTGHLAHLICLALVKHQIKFMKYKLINKAKDILIQQVNSFMINKLMILF